MPVASKTEPPPAQKRVQKVAANSLWTALDTGIGFASSLLSSVLVARALGPDKLGYYSYLIWITNMTGSIAAFGVPVATRKHMAEFLGRGDVYLARETMKLGLRFQLYVVAFVLAVGFAVVYGAVDAEHRVYALLAVCSLAPGLTLGLASAANMAAEDFAANVWPSLWSTVAGLIGAVLSIVFHWDLTGLAASILVSRLLDLVLRYALFYKRTGRAWRAVPARKNGVEELAQLRSKLLRFCLQSSFLQVITLVVWDRTGMFFLKQLSDIRQVAFYSLAFNITQQLLLLPRVFTTAATANLLSRVGVERDKTGAMAITILRYLMLIALPLTFGVAALGGPLLRFLYGSAYEAAIPVLLLLAAFASAKALMLPAQQLLIAIDRQDIIIKMTIGAGVVNIAIDLLLIPAYGAMGAAVASSVAQTLAAALIWYGAYRADKLSFPASEIARLFLSAITMGVVVAGLVLILPSTPALFAGGITGVVVFLLMLRWTKALTRPDRDRLMALQQQFPHRFRDVYRRAVAFVVPA